MHQSFIVCNILRLSLLIDSMCAFVQTMALVSFLRNIGVLSKVSNLKDWMSRIGRIGEQHCEGHHAQT
jgi:hypothetical protein